jgi:hypothetical protein
MSVHAQLMAAGTGGIESSALFIPRSAVASIVAIVAVAVALQIVAPDAVAWLQDSWLVVGAAVVALSALFVVARRHFAAQAQPSLPRMFTPMPFTFQDLSWYDGARNTEIARLKRSVASSMTTSAATPDRARHHPLPEYDGLVFVAVKGVVYNVSPEFYGPGAGYSVFAAKDSSRQLGKVQVGDEECNADWTTLSEQHQGVLADWEARYRAKYAVVGWVVPDEQYYARGAQFRP